MAMQSCAPGKSVNLWFSLRYVSVKMSMNLVPGAPPPGNGGPPTNFEMDRRLTVLETRFDTILPTLATKQDVQELRAELRQMIAEQQQNFEKLCAEMEKLRTEMFKTLNSNLKWIVGIAVTLFIGMFVINFAMWNTMKSTLDRLDRPPAAQPQ
jgi:hypothetical protein